jgi:hypothetical protein
MVLCLCQDYNTATFPTRKYYDLAAWDHKEQAEKAKQLEKERRKMTDEQRRRYECFPNINTAITIHLGLMFLGRCG